MSVSVPLLESTSSHASESANFSRSNDAPERERDPDHFVPADAELDSTKPEPEKRKRIFVEAEEIVFKAGGATITLNSASDGTIVIRAPNVRIVGGEVISEAEQTNTVAGHTVVTEATLSTNVLGKLIRIDGQCVKINC